jgi:hypothetical protein
VKDRIAEPKTRGDETFLTELGRRKEAMSLSLALLISFVSILELVEESRATWDLKQEVPKICWQNP